jgi:hypothetical protein
LTLRGRISSTRLYATRRARSVARDAELRSAKASIDKNIFCVVSYAFHQRVQRAPSMPKAAARIAPT